MGILRFQMQIIPIYQFAIMAMVVIIILRNVFKRKKIVTMNLIRLSNI